MNRQQRRASESVGRRLQRKEWNEFEDVTLESREKSDMFGRDPRGYADQVFKNNKYIVQVFQGIYRKGSFYTKVMVRRCDAAPLSCWQDLYRIKNEIFGEETEAVQFLPPKSELVDVANLYWFWILTPESLFPMETK